MAGIREAQDEKISPQMKKYTEIANCVGVIFLSTGCWMIILFELSLKFRAYGLKMSKSRCKS